MLLKIITQNSMIFCNYFFMRTENGSIFFKNSSSRDSYTCAESTIKILFKSIEPFSKNHGHQLKKSSFEKNAFESSRVNYTMKFLLTTNLLFLVHRVSLPLLLENFVRPTAPPWLKF